MLEVTDIMKILPHRYPFLLVDRIIEIEKGKKIVGIKNVSINEPFFQGHFPGKPVMPGVLIIEAMAQTGGVLLLSEGGHEGKIFYFIGIDKVKFRKSVVPGDQLRFEIVPIRVRAKTGLLEGKAFVGDTLVAEAEMMFMLADQ
ncbi:MAG: 3-hydroxyacyl-ACP dehydratase FabZ [bacterium]|nr:3-hydroxyacyl-ACP dehydratase FabZ [bacterium]